jgi:hypothetical protein
VRFDVIGEDLDHLINSQAFWQREVAALQQPVPGLRVIVCMHPLMVGLKCKARENKGELSAFVNNFENVRRCLIFGKKEPNYAFYWPIDPVHIQKKPG